jgi:hypothetical protein
MENIINTGINDKSGRSIFVDDVVQHRLGKFGKSGGTKNYKVVVYGKKYHLVDQFETDYQYGGILLTDKIAKYLIVIQSKHIRG